MSAPDLTGYGTPVTEWTARIAELPELEPAVPVSGRVVVVAPHPDDEVLGAGGALRLLAEAGARVTVLAVTDGDASHPGSPTLTGHELARRRAVERVDALTRLGLSDVDVVRLRLPDGRVAEHERWLTDVLRARLGEGDLCLAPWELDGHPDHDATGRASKAAVRDAGCGLLRFPIWMWHWADPAQPTVPWDELRRLPLSQDCTAAKRHAVRAFTTQLRPLSAHPADRAILPPPVLARLVQPYEVFLP